MKRLVRIDPETLARSEVCTFDLVEDKVNVAPAGALKRWSNVSELVLGSEILTPADGAAYYNALSSLRGTYYFVEEVPAED